MDKHRLISDNENISRHAEIATTSKRMLIFIKIHSRTTKRTSEIIMFFFYALSRFFPVNCSIELFFFQVLFVFWLTHFLLSSLGYFGCSTITDFVSLWITFNISPVVNELIFAGFTNSLKYKLNMHSIFTLVNSIHWQKGTNTVSPRLKHRKETNHWQTLSKVSHRMAGRRGLRGVQRSSVSYGLLTLRSTIMFLCITRLR